MTRRPWFRRLGPVSWYRREWFALNLACGDRLLLIVRYRPGRILTLDMGGKIHGRSMYGTPSSVEPRWSWCWRSEASRREYEAWETYARWLLRQEAERN